MATSNIKASIPCDIHSVWKVVTEVENYTWRSDLSNHISVGNLTWKTAT